MPPGWVTSAGGRTRPELVDPGIEDFGVGMIRLAGGTVVTLEANWMAAPSERPTGWQVLADRAAVGMRPLRVMIDDGRDWVDETPSDVPSAEPGMAPLMADFLERIRDGRPSFISGREILMIQALMDALYESDRLGREVPFDAALLDT